MAVLGTEQEDPNNPGGSGGSSAFAGGGTGQGATTSAASPAATSSGSFTNLQSYLNANQGAGQTMGGAVQNTVNQAGEKADKAIGAFGTAGAADAKAGTANIDPGFMNQVTAGTQNLDPAKLGSINSGVSNGSYNGPGSVDASYTGPTTAPTASYSGATDPTKVGGYGAAHGAYSGLQDLLGDGTPGKGVTGGQAGVSGILRSVYSQPGYTAGENQLDTALTTGDKGWQGVLSQLNGQWGGEGKRFDDTTAGVAAAEKAGQDASAATGKAYADAINAGQGTSAATQNIYNTAIAGQKAKAAAWQPSFDSGVAPAGVGSYGVSAPVAPAPQNSGGGGNAAGQQAAKAVGAVGQVVKAIQDTSPGQVNHQLAGAAQAAGISPTGSSVITPPPYQSVVNAISNTAPTPANVKKLNPKNWH